MPIEIVTIPCLSDNYAFLVHDSGSGRTALVDAPDAPPIQAALAQRGWTLHEVWLTHHHWDHVDGLPDLRDAFDPEVTGAAADASRLPKLDRQVADRDSFTFAGETVHVLDVSGHTVGHIAFHMPGANAVFTADSLMALGCGRVFEGTKPQMWESLKRLRALPAETIVYSGHEYTAANAAFAQTIEPDNSDLISRIERVSAARAAGQPTVPSTLADEIATNPFLRADVLSLQSALGLTGAQPADVFTEIRTRKDSF